MNEKNNSVLLQSILDLKFILKKMSTISIVIKTPDFFNDKKIKQNIMESNIGETIEECDIPHREDAINLLIKYTRESESLVEQITNEINNSQHLLYSASTLTPEQYYLLLACGLWEEHIKYYGISPATSYEVHCHFLYEDDNRKCLINISDPRFPSMHGCYPEELQLEGLRSEQKDFFKKHLPEIFQRFESQ